MTADPLVAALQAAVGTEERPVVAATRTLSPYSSSFRIEHVGVDLLGGGHEDLVLKDLSWSTMLDGARAIRDRADHDDARAESQPRRDSDAADSSHRRRRPARQHCRAHARRHTKYI